MVPAFLYLSYICYFGWCKGVVFKLLNFGNT